MSDTYYDLGTYARSAVTTASEDARRWFDRGLVWCYGFNHEEAIVCFRRALEADPGFALAHWGIAYAIGPNYNKPWAAFDDEDRQSSLETARSEIAAAHAVAGDATPVEQALIVALAARYPAGASEDALAAAVDAYADAMRDVYAAHSDDLDICALFAEALMNRTAWQLWDVQSGEPASGASTLEAKKVLETAFRRLDGGRAHPGLLHFYIHLMEMSGHPEEALPAGDALFGLVPDAGHLQHMPTHIDVLCGRYREVVARNESAIAADNKYLAEAGPLNFYTLYRCHNFHFKIYGAMFLGRYQPAIEAADAMIATLPHALLTVASPPMADWLEGFVPIRQHVLIRFGRWQEVLDQPLPDDPELFCVTTAMMRYARTVALAATGDVAAAETEMRAFEAAYERVPESRMLFNNTCRDILAVARAMAEGELEYRRANHEAAFAALRRSVALDDALPYDEPWGWMQPTRHALGALLLEQGRAEEAEAVYRADLGLDGTLGRPFQHPDNVWSLHGLHECLLRRGADEEAATIRQRLDRAAAETDVAVHSSCFCRLHTAA